VKAFDPTSRASGAHRRSLQPVRHRANRAIAARAGCAPSGVARRLQQRIFARLGSDFICRAAGMETGWWVGRGRMAWSAGCKPAPSTQLEGARQAPSAWIPGAAEAVAYGAASRADRSRAAMSAPDLAELSAGVRRHWTRGLAPGEGLFAPDNVKWRDTSGD